MLITSYLVTQKLSPTYRRLYIGGGGGKNTPSPHFFYPLA